MLQMHHDYFIPNYLPDQNQDSEEWAHQYDPNSYIAHEALRQTQFEIVLMQQAMQLAVDGE